MMLIETLLNRIPVHTCCLCNIAPTVMQSMIVIAKCAPVICLSMRTAKGIVLPWQVLFHMLGFVGLWSCAYGVWAYYVYASQGRWIYPFLVRADTQIYCCIS